MKELSKSQVENLIEFIELNFIDSIRDDEAIDNIDYVVDMMDALSKLRNMLAIMKTNDKSKTEYPYTGLMSEIKEK